MTEVELKFPVDNVPGLRTHLKELGAVEVETIRQIDEYFNHPLNDFAANDLALRIRKTVNGACVTFKGPNLDREAKIREEIELPLVDEIPGSHENAAKMRAIWIGCGFCSAAFVDKTRTTFRWVNQQTEVEICLDSVEGLGEFLELELIVEDVAHQIASAKGQLLELATRLGLKNPITTSYRMLLAIRKRESGSR